MDDRAREPGALDGRVELVEDRWDHFVAGVGVVGFDRVEQTLEVRGEELRQRDGQREVELGELAQVVEQFAQLIVIEVSEPAGAITGLVGEVRAREVTLAGPAVLPAAAFELAA